MPTGRNERFIPFVASANEWIVGIDIQKPLLSTGDWRVMYVILKNNRKVRIIGTGPSYYAALEDVADKASKMGIGEPVE